MVMDDLIVSIFCLIDDAVKALPLPRLRPSGPAPKLADSEVLAIQVAGELLGMDQDQAIFRHFRAHYRHFFPALGRINRTTFVRQAANLWKLEQKVHQHLVAQLCQPDEPLWLVDSLPLAVCRFARAKACKRLAGSADYGYDALARHTYYGLRLHLRTNAQGVIGQVQLTPASVPDIFAASDLTPPQPADGIGDRAYWSPQHAPRLAARGWRLWAPFHKRASDPQPQFSALLMRVRRIIETVNSQLVERFHTKRIWARDLWHLGHRLIRKVLSHTTALLLNRRHDAELLQIAPLVNE